MRQLNITQKDESAKEQVIKRSPKTLLQHIERIIDLIENSKLSNEFYENAKKSIAFISKMMNITTNQVVLFSVFIEKSDDSRIHLNDISKFIGCRNIKTISLMSDIDELEKRRLVRCCRDDSKNSYRVSKEVVNAIKQNIAYQPESTKNLNTNDLFKHICRLFEERENKEISSDSLLGELCSLFENNSSLIFCRQLKEYEKICAEENIFLLLLLFCHRFVNLDDDCIGFRDFEDLYEEKWVFRGIKSNLQSGDSELLKNNIFENTNYNGFGDKEYFKISTQAKEKLFAELDIKIHQADSKKDLILHNNITPKQLFYNERERSQIAQLSSLLNKENFLSIQEKLEKGGMRKGFACLFYGAPGTGKTETVYQIARSTDRKSTRLNSSH